MRAAGGRARKRMSSAEVDRRLQRNYLNLILQDLLIFFCFTWGVLGMSYRTGQAHAGEVEIPVGLPKDGITIRGDAASQWEQGSYEVWHLRGHAEVRQGEVVARGPEAILWIDRAEAFSGLPSKVIAYFEGAGPDRVTVQFGALGNPHAVTRQPTQSLTDKTWVGRFHTTAGIELFTPVASRGAPVVAPAIFERGVAARKPSPEFQVQQTQLQAPVGNELAPPAVGLAAAGQKRVLVTSRSHGRFPIKTFRDEATNEQITLVTNGFQVNVSGLDQLGNVSIEADNAVIWSPPVDFTNPVVQDARTSERPYEVYVEGNIVFRQGERVIYADKLYYNITREYGVVFRAEMLTPVKKYQGLLRVRAEVLQQVNRQHFEAYGAQLTSSRLGVPRYWLESRNMSLDDNQRQTADPFTGQPLADPANGEPQVDHQMRATSRNNIVYVAGVPVFYWPVIATDLTQPNYYVNGISFLSDRVYGKQLRIDYNAYQVLGIRNPPPGTRWGFSTDYLSYRGVGLGTDYHYNGPALLGMPGTAFGFVDAWGLPYDKGIDNLGADRRATPLESTTRGRVLGNFRQLMPDGYQVTAEVGYTSDRNFLEQYFPREWDIMKDQTTDVELKRLVESSSWNITGGARLNPFFTQTQWLPRGDHYYFGSLPFTDRLVWHEHTSIGYAQLKVASTPTNPVDLAKFQLLPWELNNRQGVRAVTRQELDLPIQAGPVKVVPYLLGEAGYWGQDVNGVPVTRLFGQAGVKASLPFVRTDPEIKSELLNLNGLSHKVTMEGEFLYARTNQNVTRFPFYDNLDDDSTEHFRRRLIFNTFNLPAGSQVPYQFDARSFAIRSDLQGYVASPSAEVVDNLTALRLGLNDRWQTKRGLEGQERVIDWIKFDANATLFPNANRDNFGKSVGLVDYASAWYVGDRVTLLSDGFYDVFNQGLHQVTMGASLTRPEYGNVYVGYRASSGPFMSSLLITTLSYRMSEKWIATGGTYFDFSKTGNIVETLGFTRVGESFLINAGFVFNASTNNLGAQFTVEPRFLPGSRLGRVGGVQIPPAGSRGLE